MDHDEMAKANMRAVNEALINERDRLEAECEELLARIRRLENQLREVTQTSEYWQRQAVNNG
jgi:chaperonin cofactor prefoldin